MKKLVFALLLLQATAFADECRIINDTDTEITTVCNYNDTGLGSAVGITTFAKNGTRCSVHERYEDGHVFTVEYTLDNFKFVKRIDEYGFTTESYVDSINSSEECRREWNETKKFFKKD